MKLEKKKTTTKQNQTNKVNIRYKNYSGFPFEMQLLTAIKYGQKRSRLCNPLAHQARWKTKTIPSEIGFSTLTSGAFLNQKPDKQTSHE